MKVMGLDLSLTGTGVVVIDDLNLTAFPILADTLHTKFTGMERLAYIRGEIGKIVSRECPSLICIEGYSFHSQFSQAHSQGELGGVIKLMIYRNNVKYRTIPPSQLKKFVTGKGSSKKEEMIMAVYKKWGFESKTSDEADAYGLAKIALALSSTVPELTAVQKEVIEQILNPTVKVKKKK